MSIVVEEALEISPEHQAILDDILEENRDKPGATMVVLTLAQEQIGYVSPPMQKYLGRCVGGSPEPSLRGIDLLLLLPNQPAWPP